MTPRPIRPAKRLLLCALGLLVLEVQGQDTDALESFTKQFCIRCHGGAEPEGKLALDVATGNSTAAWPPGILRKIRARLVAKEMPPAGEPAPEDATARAILDGIDLRLKEAATTALAARPPRVTLRRLSRVEYANTIRDLLGVEAKTDDFPADDLGYGFDNIGDVLGISPLTFEKFLAAAERAAEEAILLDDPNNPEVRHFEAETMSCTLDGPPQRRWRNLFSNGSVSAACRFPREGSYVARVRAFGQQAGGEVTRLTVDLDERTAATVEVPATEEAPGTYEIPFRAGPGRRTISIAFVNDYFNEKAKDPKDRDRNLVLDWVEVVGPEDRRPKPFAQRWILEAAGTATEPESRARACCGELASRAWRRPATSAEVDGLTKLVLDAVREKHPFETGLQRALTAVLVSPHFLFRVELGPRRTADPGAETLGPNAIAARLSYFLWSSLPDATLRAHADQGGLRDSASVVAEARRMLRDARATELSRNFAAQWLEIRNLADASPDPTLFPGFDDRLREAMRSETELVFEAILRERRPAREILEADFTFVNEALARHYGIPGVVGSGFRRVAIDDSRRGGILGHASILTVTSNPTRTSPVKRGKWILENLLDAPPPAPPPGVGALDERREIVLGASLRERLERHRVDPSCSSCHARMDALGFALENFDAVGLWRDKDGSFPIDANGTLPDGTTISSPATLRRHLAQGNAFLRCVAKKLLTYALGRGPVPEDESILDALVAGLPSPDPTLEDLILAIVATDAFRLRPAGG